MGVSGKTVSKWETAKGYPDITLLEPIADAFKINGVRKIYFCCNRDGLFSVDVMQVKTVQMGMYEDVD